MSINFHQEWKGLTAEEQNAILAATDSYTSYLYKADTAISDIYELSADKMHELTEQYIRGPVTMEGLEAMSNPDYWEKTLPYMENIIPELMQEYSQNTGIPGLEELIGNISNFAYLDATGMQGNNLGLPNFKSIEHSIAG